MIVGAHDWTGELAANGLVLPLFPRRDREAKFPQYALDAFSYGTAVKKLYGAPVALENIGLVVNTKLAKVPTTFAQLQASALAFKKKKAGNLAIAVQQGAGGDAYHMYPLFSGLCGYIFGKNTAGNLDPSDIGVANPKFLKNAALIDKWNKLGPDQREGRLRRRLAGRVPQGQGGVLDHRAVEPRHAQEGGTHVPDLAGSRRSSCKSVPFLGVAGLHGHEVRGRRTASRASAKDLVSNYMMSAARSSRSPPRTAATRRTSTPASGSRTASWRSSARPSTGGVPMPNIPQMDSVWGDLGAAWVKSTKGSGRVTARGSFLGRRAEHRAARSASRCEDGGGRREAPAPVSVGPGQLAVTTPAREHDRTAPEGPRPAPPCGLALPSRAVAAFSGTVGLALKLVLLAIANAIGLWAAVILAADDEVDRASASSSSPLRRSTPSTCSPRSSSRSSSSSRARSS